MGKMNPSKLPRETNNITMNKTFFMKYQIQGYNGDFMRLIYMKYFRITSKVPPKSNYSPKKNAKSYMK